MPGLANSLKGIITSPGLIFGSEPEDRSGRLAGTTDGGPGPGIILHAATGPGANRGLEDALAKSANHSVMDQTQPAMIKDADYVVDVILPTILIALLFVGNAVIVYIIFQYRKRNVGDHFRKTTSNTRMEDIALNVTTNGEPQV